MLRIAPIAAALTVALAVTRAAAPALADERGAAETTRALLGELVATPSAENIEKTVEALAKTSADSVEALSEFLARPRESSDADRRAVLAKIGAAVPNEKGRFVTPGRQTPEEKEREDKLDWLEELSKLSGPAPALGDVIADVVAIRALAASHQVEAARVMLDFAFDEVGIIYRDECGRYLRNMAPHSLPALIIASQDRKVDASKARYATYQLERMDRQNPNKAVDAADPDLKIEILKAFADSQYREAVYATLDHVDHPDPQVRAAARAAWDEYTTGRPPPEPPKRKLQLPGGKLTDEAEPLWLDHRELADIEIRKRLEELTGTAPAAKASLADMSQELYAFYDGQRDARLQAQFSDAKTKAGQGQWAAAAELYDKILAQRPEWDRKSEMAEVYFRLGESLQAEKKWHDASTAFAKAHAMDPDGPRGGEALAAHHYSRGQMKKDASGDGSAELARARELDPEHGGGGGASGKPSWMLYGGAVGFAAGALFLILALVQRRRRA